LRERLLPNFSTDIDLEPKISEQEALATVKENMPPNERIEVRRSQLFIYELDSKDRLVWRFILYHNQNQDYGQDYGAIVYVDAMTGKIAKKYMPRIDSLQKHPALICRVLFSASKYMHTVKLLCTR